jgi:predicted KAP-like P-loop ATPase
LDKFSEILSASAEMTSNVERSDKSAEQLLSDAHAAMADSNGRAVILIDEVDRLMPGEILQLFRLVRMVANFPNTTYVVAFDRQMVVDALAAQFNGARLAASRYLEKIFQAEIPLPFPETTLIKQKVVEKLDEILSDIGVADYDTASERELARFSYLYDRHFSEAFRNMRVAKRFWSQVNTLLPLVKDDVNIADFLTTEAFRASDPEGFEAVRANLPKFFYHSSYQDNTRKAHQALVAEIAVSVSLPDVEGLLSTLFPRFGGFEGDDGDDAIRGMRVSSERFASRYFNYSVSRYDISSRVVRDMIKNANDGASQYELLKETVENKPLTLSRLLEDLSAFAPTLSATETRTLTHDLVRLMRDVPERASFFGSNARDVERRL